MSRHSGSSRNKSHGVSTKNVDNNSEDLVNQVKGVVEQLNDVVSNRPNEWESYLPSARSAITALDHLRFFRDPQRFAEQVWILHGLQDYSFHEPDSGVVRDIAEWTQNSWLRVLRNFPDSEEVFAGLGRNWLQRAQETLAKIHREEGNDPSSQDSEATCNTWLPSCINEFAADKDTASDPSDPRRQGPLYSEARSYLQPATDYYTRAVRAADALSTTSGDLLAQAAHSQISLGNVTPSPADERYFTQAIRYLRRADNFPSYTLSIYLQEFLDSWGRYVS